MTTFKTIADAEGWTEDTQLAILGEFVSQTPRMQTYVDEEAIDVASMENGTEDDDEEAQIEGTFDTLVFEQGWNEASQISIILSAVSNAKKNDELADFAAAKTAKSETRRKNRP